MIKFTAKAKGRNLVGLGLLKGNISRLKEHKPIFVHLDEMGLPPIDILIMLGDTTEEIMDQMDKLGLEVGEDTKFNIDPRFDENAT